MVVVNIVRKHRFNTSQNWP